MGFLDRLRARREARKNPLRPPPMVAEQKENIAALDAQAAAAGGQYDAAFGQVANAKAGFDALAAGQGPSLAQAQLESASGRNIASQMALAGQARGGNLAGMAAAAQATGAGMALETNQQLAELRAQEQLAAMQGSAGLAGEMAGMSSDRQMGLQGMQQQAFGSLADRDVAWRLSQQQAKMGKKEGNRAFGLGIVDRGLGAVEAAAGLGAFSDKALKRDIKPAKSPLAMLLLAQPSDDLELDTSGGVTPSSARDALKKLTAYEYEYNEEGRAKGMPEGKVLGVMAQDLERSKAGRDVVEERDGRRWLDGRKALSLVLAGAADHEKRLAALEGGR